MNRKLGIGSSIVAAVAVTSALAAPPAMADWLVTHDGARVETKGPWKVEGRRILFTMPNGTLSVMRASEVDLEASEQVTREANAPPAPVDAKADQKKELPKPVLVLTNKDIPKGSLEEGDGKPRPEVLPSLADREPVQVVAWKRIDTEDGIELRGTVRNTGRALAANVSVRAEVSDEEGEVVGTGNAFLGNSSLVSGKSTSFRIVLPEVIDFAGNPVFSVTSTKLTVGGAAIARGKPADAPATGTGSSASGQPPATGAAADQGATIPATAEDSLGNGLEEEPGEQVDESAERP